MSTVEQRTLKVISDILNQPVKVDDSLESLKADSLDHIEIIMALESEFDIEIHNDEIHTLKTINDHVEIVNNKLGGK